MGHKSAHGGRRAVSPAAEGGDVGIPLDGHLGGKGAGGGSHMLAGSVAKEQRFTYIKMVHSQTGTTYPSVGYQSAARGEIRDDSREVCNCRLELDDTSARL